MKLDAILALDPGPGQTSAAYAAAISFAATKRAEVAERLAEAEQVRRAHVLETDDKTMLQAERDASAARLAIDRLDAIVIQLRASMDDARGREIVTELQAEAAKVNGLIAKVEQWQEQDFPLISEMIGRGLHAEQEAIEAYGTLLARIDGAFASQSVRDAAPNGVLVKAPGGHRPSHLFPTWALPQNV